MNFLKPKKETIDEVKEYLEKRYILTMCQLEIKLYQARIDGMKSKSQRYFNSTPLRNAFARMMVYSKYVNSFYTISEIVRELRTNRQSVSTMVDECSKEGWIFVKKEKNKLYCTATKDMLDGFHDYVKWRKKIAADHAVSISLLDYEYLLSNNFTLFSKDM